MITMSLTKEKKNKMFFLKKNDLIAQVVKLVDTRDLKSLEGNFVPVQVRPWAPFKTYEYVLRYFK